MRRPVTSALIFAALAEDRPDRAERPVQDDAEAHEEREGDERHRRR